MKNHDGKADEVDAVDADGAGAAATDDAAHAKRELIRSAAKRLFSEHGLARTSVRDISREAGYTTGALYFHYRSKEDLYADILRESLTALYHRIDAAMRPRRTPMTALGAAFRAFVAFYDEHPRDFELSLYLMQGVRRVGLNATLDGELNGLLLDTLALFRGRLADLHIPPRHLDAEVGVLVDEMLGALVASHTGRLFVIGTDLAQVVDRHVANLERRLTEPSPSPRGSTARAAGAARRASRRPAARPPHRGRTPR